MYSIDKQLNFEISISDMKMLWKYRRELVLVRKLNTQPHKNLRYMKDGMYGDQRNLRTGEIDELYTLDITGLTCILLIFSEWVPKGEEDFCIPLNNLSASKLPANFLLQEEQGRQQSRKVETNSFPRRFRYHNYKRGSTYFGSTFDDLFKLQGLNLRLHNVLN